MLTTFYTFDALVRAWTPDLVDCTLGDAFSQVRDELTLAFTKPEGAWMVRLSVRGGQHFLFRSEGYSKARRNVATLFEDALGATVAGLRMAERDRMVYLDLADGRRFQLMLFGPKANAFLTDADGTILEAFQRDAELAGTTAPTPRAAPEVATFADFEARWRPNRRTTEQAVAAAFPLFDRLLAAEVVHRAGVTAEAPGDCTEADRRALFEAGRAVIDALATPEPHIYWDGRFADAFSLLPLRHRAHQRAEPFDDVDAAVRVFTRRMLAQARFRQLYAPLEKALTEAAAHYRTSAERMLEELSNESRAGRYETWGHLLMAAPQDVPTGAEEVTLPDLFGEAETVTIPLDPAKSPIENAQHYYGRARRTRESRAHAEERLLDTEARAEEAETLLAELQGIDALSDLQAFRKDEADRLARFVGDEATEADRVPFRRYDLGRGYQVWVGRNARQNDDLTFHHAQKYDLWMHARGVPGSHAVLRLPNRQAEPDPALLHRAAAIAAYYSKARGSGLVAVMVAPRKYVRKPKGAAPGAVVVEREEVVLVEPGLPEG